MGKFFLSVALLLWTNFLSAECLKERQERAHEVVAELLPKAKLIDSSLEVQVVACNIHILGTIYTTKSLKKKNVEKQIKSLEDECQRLFNAGLVKVKDAEEMNKEKDINGACVSSVKFKKN